MDQRDYRMQQMRVAGLQFSEPTYSPAYAGEDFERACTVAKRIGASVWERHTRDWWNVSYGRPPYALSDAPDVEHWDEV